MTQPDNGCIGVIGILYNVDLELNPDPQFVYLNKFYSGIWVDDCIVNH